MFRPLALASMAMMMAAPTALAETEIHLYDHVSYYDGYLVERIPEDAPDQGVTRLYTYLNTVKMTDEQLDMIGEHLRLDVQIHAVCDNYDRIGSVNLAFVPKGQESYRVVYKDEEDPMRIEIARFITPFMSKNKNPKTVPYTFQIDNLSSVLRDPKIRENYDVWVELEVFGVPYAAQQQITGCKDCIEVFQGSLWFTTDDTPAAAASSDVFVPVVTRRSDWRADRGMNNYNEACTDELGRTIKTYSFTTPVDVNSGRIVIMMSNHGAGTNGEEYERRMHYASLDGELALQWKPGRTSCEPFRKYNTQRNGIYGFGIANDEYWQSFSNWCPGAPIPYQTFEVGALAAGEHSVTIEVPDAVFYGSDGFFPVSIYFQGDTDSNIVTAPADFGEISQVDMVDADDYTTELRYGHGTITAMSPCGIVSLEIYDLDGRMVMIQEGASGADSLTCSIAHLGQGVYVAAIRTPQGVEARKIAI